MKIRGRQVMQVCHRGRNKQRDCGRKSRRVMERESGKHRQRKRVARIINMYSTEGVSKPSS